ncbi:MAG TPA: S-layer homology domain-containing protein [Chthonomonadaceae bacterium]|nr:S-layer homology domain-containing protein [Chthonomonadaceae bacterium]
MRKLMPYLGAALSVLALAWSLPATAQDNGGQANPAAAQPFRDVPDTHWAYQAVTDLQSKGILIGYPDGYFRGKRTLTRYEFAIALERALKAIPTQAGPPGPAGPQGEVGPPGPPGMTPEEVAELRRLTDEFRNELAALGNNVRDINNRLDQLARDVADIRNRLERMIQFNGDFFFGGRADRSRYPFLDYSGAARPAGAGLFTTTTVTHDFHLEAHAHLPGGVMFNGDAAFSNYLDYRGGSLGGEAFAFQPPYTERVNLYQAELDIPIGSFGANTMLTVGRFKHQVTPLTYYRPKTDAYFDLPWYDDGNWVEDGVRLTSKFGSATTSLWAGQYDTTGDNFGDAINKPIVGAVYGPRTIGENPFFPNRPTDLSMVERGAIAANKSAGLHIGVPLAHIGEIGATLMDFTQGAEGAAAEPFVPFHNVVVYGANVKFNPILGHFLLSGEWAKSVQQLSFDTGSGLPNDDNNAFLANVGYSSGPLAATLGWMYIDPAFGAPGYWDKIGAWENPTNVSGPFVNVHYNFSNTIQGYLGGEFLEGARNRHTGALAGTATPLGGFFGNGFGIGDKVYRGTAGVKVNLSRMVNLRADYEGDFWNFGPAGSPTGMRAKPIEQYLTIGAGLNLASNTVLKLAYQIISVRDVGAGFGGLWSGLPASEGDLGGVPGGVTNATVFTTQVAVHF